MFLGRVLRIRYFVEGHVVVLIQFKECVHHENECLKQENQELKAENRTLKAKLEKAYDFMRQFTINGMNMLEHFLRSIGEWVQQKVAGMNR